MNLAATLARVDAVLARLTGPRWRRWWLIAAAAMFFAGASAAALTVDLGDLDLSWPLVVAVAATIPVTAYLTGTEYSVTAGAIEQRVPPGQALRVAVAATAANLLPLPAGAAVRIQAMRTEGATGRRAVGATAAAAFLWLGASALAAAVVLVPGNILPAGAFGVAATLSTALGLAVLRSLAPSHLGRTVGALALVEITSVAVTAFRIYLALRAVGVAASAGDAVVLASSVVISSFVAVFPSGLGIREAIAAGLAPLVGLGAAEVFLAMALVRIASMLVYSLMALTLVRGQSAPAEERPRQRPPDHGLQP